MHAIQEFQRLPSTQLASVSHSLSRQRDLLSIFFSKIWAEKYTKIVKLVEREKMFPKLPNRTTIVIAEPYKSFLLNNKSFLLSET